MNKIDLDIDITGICNLHCPTCPQGNVSEYRLPQGFMKPELLASIVGKAASEAMITGINLFNWTEPLLHPELPELIRIVQDRGISCYLSSNLNLPSDFDAIMAKNPTSFKISVSGFTQKVYGATHRGGNIERVKKNMAALADAKKRANSDTRICVIYHRYRHNLKEASMMQKFAADLGIDFQPVWALMFPLEKILTYTDGTNSGFRLTDEDHRLIDLLALPPKKALAIAQKSHCLSCRLRDAQVSLDFQGNVMLCCGIFDARKYTIGNFMEMPLAGIQALREKHPLCARCMHHGAHQYLTNLIPEMEELILESVPPEDVQALEQELAQERLERHLQKIYQKLFSKVLSIRQKTVLKSRVHSMLRSAWRINRTPDTGE